MMPPDDPNNPDDAALLVRFRTRDRAAFDQLYDRYAGRVLAFAYHLTGSRTDAEDLTQETFLAAFRGAEQFRGGSRLLTWLLSITVRRWRDERRKPRPATAPLLDDTDSDFSAGVSSVESGVVATLAFRQAVATLDEPLRAAFLLVAAQELSYREAADVLRIPVGTVKWRVHIATKRLRTALTDSPFSDSPLETTNDEPKAIVRTRA